MCETLSSCDIFLIGLKQLTHLLYPSRKNNYMNSPKSALLSHTY